jgi:ribosomal protein S12 methylthiotransferase
MDRTFHLVSLGCARNQVDSEIMSGQLQNAGWRHVADPAEAEAIVVNTCSFIEPAVEESIDTILELTKLKQAGGCRKLIVTGCMPERFREPIAEALPEVDIFLGTGAFDRIVDAVQGEMSSSACWLPDPETARAQPSNTPRTLTDTHTAYIKIAEGCSRHCTYCMIPRLRGRQISRPPTEIIAEAERLFEQGARELVLVAQDSTSYGSDLGQPSNLTDLLTPLSELSARHAASHAAKDDALRLWVRVLYGHPESIDDSMIRAIGNLPGICPYFDIPVQHASRRILKRMGRNYTEEALRELFDKIRSLVPHATLRTTVIVGFPGETDRDFDTLMRFVQETQFDHLGSFVYSDAEELPAHTLDHHVPPKVAQRRYDRLMQCQAKIALAHNRRRIGEAYHVLVDEQAEEALFYGRTNFQAPEVDGLVYIRVPDLTVGQFYQVKITDAMEYDLIGEVV